MINPAAQQPRGRPIAEMSFEELQERHLAITLKITQLAIARARSQRTQQAVEVQVEEQQRLLAVDKEADPQGYRQQRDLIADRIAGYDQLLFRSCEELRSLVERMEALDRSRSNQNGGK